MKTARGINVFIENLNKQRLETSEKRRPKENLANSLQKHKGKEITCYAHLQRTTKEIITVTAAIRFETKWEKKRKKKKTHNLSSGNNVQH